VIVIRRLSSFPKQPVLQVTIWVELGQEFRITQEEKLGKEVKRGKRKAKKWPLFLDRFELNSISL